MNIKLDHISLSVTNLDESIQWYGNIFGFELVESGKYQEGNSWGIVALNDSMICMSEYPERTPADKSEKGTAHHIYHFGIRVSDLESWKKTVQRYKLQLYYGGQTDYKFSTSWYVRDPSGHEIEVSFTDGDRLQFP